MPQVNQLYEASQVFIQRLEDGANIIERPSHYIAGGIEARHVIQSWCLGWELGTAVKYILRAGRKDDEIADLLKCREYLKFAVASPNDLDVRPGRLVPRHSVPDGYQPKAVAEAFGLSERRANALAAICRVWPHKEDAEAALAEINAEIEYLETQEIA